MFDFTASMPKEAGMDMDLMLRMRILEGVLGVPRWSLSRSPQEIRGALMELPKQYPEIDPSWFASKDFKLYESALEAAEKVLHGEGTSLTAEEVVQNMVSGLNPAGEVQVRDALGEIGKAQRDKILSGRLKVTGVRTAIWPIAFQRARDVIRKHLRQKKKREQMSPTMLDVGMHPGQASADEVMQEAPMEAVLSFLSGPQGREVKNWIYRTMRQTANPIQMAVMEALLDDPGATNAELGRSPQVLELRGGEPISGQMVGRHRDNVVETIREEIGDNPRVFDLINRELDLEALARGRSFHRFAQKVAAKKLMAARVAARYLSQNTER